MNALVLLSAAVASAASIPVVNPGFEATALSDGGFVFGAPGWVVVGSAGTFNPTSFEGIAPEGNNVSFAAGGTLTQNVGVPLAGSTEYVLRVEIVERLDLNIGNYQVRLLAGAAVVAEDDSTLDPGNGNFLVSTISYISTEDDPLIGQPLSIVLSSGVQQVNFDEVSLTETAVAPSVPALGTIGIAVLLATLGTTASRRLQISHSLV